MTNGSTSISGELGVEGMGDSYVMGNFGVGVNSPGASLDVGGKIVMRNETDGGDSNNVVATKGYVDNKMPPTCNQENYALQYNAVSGVWSCVLIEGGNSVPVPDLVGGLHTSEQCVGLGGTVVTVSQGKLCRFNGTSCNGMTQYLDYSATSPNTCSGTVSGCTTGSHSFSNNTRELCIARNFPCTAWNPNTGGCIAYTNSVCWANPTQIGCY